MSLDHVHVMNPPPGHLKRTVGFYGLMFVSLGSIIGSGWLLGALNAAKVAGPASVISWILAAAMLTVLALTYAELGGAYPVAGGNRAVPVLLARPTRRFHRGLGVLAAGRRDRAHRDSRGHHLREQHQKGATTLPDDPRHRPEGDAAQRARAHRRHGRDGSVHRDEPGRRQVHVREQLPRRHLEDRCTGAGHHRRGVAVLPRRQLPRRRRVRAVRRSRDPRGPAGRCGLRPARVRAMRAAGRGGEESQA